MSRRNMPPESKIQNTEALFLYEKEFFTITNIPFTSTVRTIPVRYWRYSTIVEYAGAFHTHPWYGFLPENVIQMFYARVVPMTVAW